MSQIRVPLRPGAKGIDAFAPVEVRGIEDHRLGQLAQGLSVFNRGLSSFADAMHDREKQEGFEEAAKLFNERQFKNIKDFEEAVKSGQIPQSANPWFIYSLRQLAAKEQVRTGLLRLEDMYHTSTDPAVAAVRQSQDLEVVDDWIKRQAAQEFDGEHGPEVSVILAETMSDWKANFLSRQSREWQGINEQTFDIAFRRQLGHGLEPLAWAAADGIQPVHSMSDRPSDWTEEDETEFRQWYSNRQEFFGLDPDPDNPKNFYNYRMAHRSGVEPAFNGAWDPKFRTEGHPAREENGIDTVTGLPAGSFGTNLTPLWNKVQENIDNTLMVAKDDEQVRHSAMQSLRAMGIASRSHEFIEAAANTLKINGKSLRELALPGEIAAIRDDIDQAIASKYSQQRFMEKARGEQAAQAVLGQWGTYSDGIRRAGGIPDPNKFAVQVGSLPPDEQVRVNQIIGHLAAQDVSRSVSALMATTDPTGPGTLSLIEHLVTSNIPGARDAAAWVQGWRDFNQRSKYAEVTSPDLQQRLTSLITDSSRTPAARIKELTELTQAGVLSYEDQRRTMGTLMSLGRVGRDSAGATLSRYMKLMENELQAAALREPALQAAYQEAVEMGERFSLPLEKQNEIQSKVLLLQEDFERLFADNPNPTLTQVDEIMKKRFDSTTADIKQSETKRVQDAKRQAVLLDPVRAIEGGDLRWDGAKFVSTIDGVTQPENPRLFNTTDEFITGWSKAAASVGVTDREGKVLFLNQQMRKYPLTVEQRSRLFSEAKRELWDGATVDEANALYTRVTKSVQSWASTVSMHQEAINDGDKVILYASGLGGMSKVYPQETVDSYKRQLQELQLLQERIHLLMQGPRDVEEVRKAYDAIIEAEKTLPGKTDIIYNSGAPTFSRPAIQQK